MGRPKFSQQDPNLFHQNYFWLQILLLRHTPGLNKFIAWADTWVGFGHIWMCMGRVLFTDAITMKPLIKIWPETG